MSALGVGAWDERADTTTGQTQKARETDLVSSFFVVQKDERSRCVVTESCVSKVGQANPLHIRPTTATPH